MKEGHYLRTPGSQVFDLANFMRIHLAAPVQQNLNGYIEIW